MARIRSSLRSGVTEESMPVIKCNNLIIDLSARTVKKNNELLKLTRGGPSLGGRAYNLSSEIFDPGRTVFERHLSL